MATEIITCPSCGSRYKTAAAAGSKLPCPQCGAEITIPARPAAPAPSNSPGLSADLLADLDADLETEEIAERSRTQHRPPSRRTGGSVETGLVPFLGRLAVGVGIVSGLIVLLGAIGWFSEPIGMAAAILGIVAMVGLALAGKIWLVVIGFQKSTSLGLVAIFVPLSWIYFLNQRIGRSRFALAVTLSSLIPAVVSLVVVGALQTRHTPEGRRAARSARMEKKADRFVDTVLRNEAANPPTGEPRKATFRYSLRIEDPAKFTAEGDRVMSQFAGYVKQSLTVDQAQRTVTFQHRGSNELESQYRLYLASKTGVLLNPSPE